MKRHGNNSYNILWYLWKEKIIDIQIKSCENLFKFKTNLINKPSTLDLIIFLLEISNVKVYVDESDDVNGWGWKFASLSLPETFSRRKSLTMKQAVKSLMHY